MPFADLRLALMTFARRWDGASLGATIVVLPSGDPTAPLLPGTTPFAGTALSLRAGAIASLNAEPSLVAATYVPLALGPAPVHAAELFALLRAKFAPQDTVGVRNAAKAGDTISKALPPSYVALLPPGAERDPHVATLDEFGCTLRSQDPAPVSAAPRTTSWGEVISLALRNRFLAGALGLRYTVAIDGDAAASLAANGGWLFATLASDDPYFAAWDGGAADAVRSYAARIPPLPAPRRVFSAVLFPVVNPKSPPSVPDGAEIDRAQREAELYADGFAKLVHARQPDSLDAHVGDGKTTVNAATDAGIQIGWDDEQVLRWHNRQLAISAAQQTGAEPSVETPLGVLGYRVDVRIPVPGEPPSKRNVGWHSLMAATGTVPDEVRGKVPPFDGELLLEPTPSAPASAGARQFWLPLYFAQWRGTPLAVRDDTPHLLAGGTAAGVPGAIAPQPTRYAGGVSVPLVYGTTYEFRTRLVDLAGEGPEPGDIGLDEAVAERASVTFSRWVAPKGLRIAPLVDAPHAPPRIDRLAVTRPLIAYPEALFTQRYGSDPAIADAARSALLAQLGLAPDGTPGGGPPAKNDVLQTGLPDPDVVALEIVLEVRALAHDRADEIGADGAWRRVYTMTRAIPPLAPLVVDPDAGIDPARVAADVAIPPLDLAYVDVDDVAALAAASTGPLAVPRARDVRILVTPLAAAPEGVPAYFGTFPADAGRAPVTRGVTSHVLVRAEADAEPDALFAQPADARPALQALFFRPRSDGDAVAALMRDLADALGMRADGLTLRARPGIRVLFGTTGFKSTIAADGGAITFASAEEIFRHWTVAMQWELARDWTWDALDDACVHVLQVPKGGGDAVEIGTIAVPRSVAADALTATPDRTRTRLVFLHAIDPAHGDPRDGFKERDAYRFVARVRDENLGVAAVASDDLAVRLPLALPPAAMPSLASAGYALSPYRPSEEYATTETRTRRLWIEVPEAPAPGDRLFVRLLAYAPDPLLYADATLRETPPAAVPPLALDPEYVRTIVPGQSRDDDGHDAMLELADASPDDPHRYLLPLPEGVAPDDPRLFGMWTYELRFGHVDPWSLAQARFGRPFRIAGVQHPAPDLPCTAVWQRADELVPGPPRPGGGIRIGAGIRTRWTLVAHAPYATPVANDGRRVGSGVPLTTIGFLVYAQVIQADGTGYRNVLLAHGGASPVLPRQTPHGTVYDYGAASFDEDTLRAALLAQGLPETAALSIVAVEFFPPGGRVGELERDVYPDGRRLAGGDGGESFDPFADRWFGKLRILRTSVLTKVEPFC